MKDPLLVFYFVQLLAFARGNPDMLGNDAVIFIRAALEFGCPKTGPLCLQQGFLRSCSCHWDFTLLMMEWVLHCYCSITAHQLEHRKTM